MKLSYGLCKYQMQRNNMNKLKILKKELQSIVVNSFLRQNTCTPISANQYLVCIKQVHVLFNFIIIILINL